MAIKNTQEQKIYNFDSVGVLETVATSFVIETADSPPIGIKTPVQLDEMTDDFFVMQMIFCNANVFFVVVLLI